MESNEKTNPGVDQVTSEEAYCSDIGLQLAYGAARFKDAARRFQSLGPLERRDTLIALLPILGTIRSAIADTEHELASRIRSMDVI